MIWGLLIACVILTALYLSWPFLSVADAEPQMDQLAEVRDQRARVDADEQAGRLTTEAAEKSRDALDRRIVALLDSTPKSPRANHIRTIGLFGTPLVLMFGTVLTYQLVGEPTYTPVTIAELRAEQALTQPDSLDSLVEQLQQRLASDAAAPADGYVLLARSLISLGRFDEGLAAYDRAIELSGSAADLVTERADAVAFIQQAQSQPPIDPETMAQIRQMSPEQQADMIEGMVDGLAARLADDPLQPEGWQRLIRARLVLEQYEQARSDLTTARGLFADDPDVLAALSSLETDLPDGPQPAVPD